MKNIKLSELYGKKELTEEQIDNIIFNDIFDDGKQCEYGIVFGNPEFQTYRIQEAVKLYKTKRINKLILTGGIGENTEGVKKDEKEAWQMRKIAIEMGVLADDILIEDNSRTTIENCVNVAKLLAENDVSVERIMLISSQWHLKRCLAIAKKHISSQIDYSFGIAKDGIADKEVWKKNEKGIAIVENEIKILSIHSKQNLIYDLKIEI